MEDEQIRQEIIKSDSVIKTLCSIMNEEDDIDAYYEKSPEEMVDIIKLIDARFPDKKMASYDPIYTRFGQVFRNGYNTFGIDFLTALTRRTDETVKLCLKGLNDIIENQDIQISNLSVIVELLLKIISEGTKEEQDMLIQAINEEKELTDLDFMQKYLDEVNQETNEELRKQYSEEN